MTNSKQSHGTRALLGPEDVNKLKLIYLKFQMSCSQILKNETLPVGSFSISKLELPSPPPPAAFYFVSLHFLKLLFSGPFFLLKTCVCQ